jgi:hypothetical protein
MTDGQPFFQPAQRAKRQKLQVKNMIQLQQDQSAQYDLEYQSYRNHRRFNPKDLLETFRGQNL